ncbi:MAG: ricin-type beta-trefoil lectin domain protein [Pseudomonadota bacterium]
MKSFLYLPQFTYQITRCAEKSALYCALTFAAVSPQVSVAQTNNTAPIKLSSQSNLCLDVQGAGKTNGTPVMLWTCHGGDNQKWEQSNNRLVVYGNKCLDVPGGNTKDGTGLIIWDCQAGNNNQRWVKQSASFVWSGTKCLDTPQGTVGSRASSSACNGTANQQWNSAVAAISVSSLPAASTCDLPNFKQELLTLINEARASGRLCGSTNYSPAAALQWNDLLFKAAAVHSTNMAGKNFFSHTGQDGSNPGTRMLAAGYSWRAYAENIALGYSTPYDVMNAWLKSPGHCSGIMNANLTEVAVSCSKNPAATPYWTMDLGKR